MRAITWLFFEHLRGSLHMQRPEESLAENPQRCSEPRNGLNMLTAFADTFQLVGHAFLLQVPSVFSGLSFYYMSSLNFSPSLN